ncbi:MAG: adenine deaminase [Pirellulaceae bacterium]|nr:adenine deaminase [Pirellulaceae bacterium]
MHALPYATPTPEQLARRIRVALGQEPGDLLIAGGQVVNVFTGQVERANVVVADDWIAGVGDYAWTARETVDAAGQFVLPGLIDAHMHLESTLLAPAELARVVVPHGTTTIIADPHEVGNVLGIPGIEALLAAAAGLPLDVFFLAPSCVPCTAWEHSGAKLAASDIVRLLANPRVLGLAEVMDFPAVLAGDAAVLAKVAATQSAGAAVDGHAPEMTGQGLVAYAAAGIRSDHESTTAAEAKAKAALGMLVQVREGTGARNLNALLPAIVAGELGDWCLATDDIYPHDLTADGHIDGLLARVVAAGVAAPLAVRHATLVPARHYGLRDRGAVAPSYRADLAIVADLASFRPRTVIQAGRVVARDGGLIAPLIAPPLAAANTIHVPELPADRLELRLTSEIAPVITVRAGQITTERRMLRVASDQGRWKFAAASDVLLAAAIERHRGTGSVGLGLVQGFGLTRGGIGSSVAHDSHNLILAGTEPRELLAAANALRQSGGGLVVVADGQVLAQLPLPLAGLISTADARTVCRQLAEIHAAAKSLGCVLPSPFLTLSFLALPVIPELRITDQGLFDVTRQAFVTL